MPLDLQVSSVTSKRAAIRLNKQNTGNRSRGQADMIWLVVALFGESQALFTTYRFQSIAVTAGGLEAGNRLRSEEALSASKDNIGERFMVLRTYQNFRTFKPKLIPPGRKPNKQATEILGKSSGTLVLRY